MVDTICDSVLTFWEIMMAQEKGEERSFAFLMVHKERSFLGVLGSDTSLR